MGKQMTQTSYTTVPVTRYVIAVAAAVLLIVGLGMVFCVFEPQIPDSAGIVIVAIPTMAGIGWFGYSMKRPMINAERFWFSAGVTFVYAALPIAIIAGLLIIRGIPLSLEGADQMTGNGLRVFADGLLFKAASVVAPIIFAQAYVLAWLLTRKLSVTSVS
jgi:hypothetical protein